MRTKEMKSSQLPRPSHRLCIVCATPMMIHFFLKEHVHLLSEFAEITIVTNMQNDPQTPALNLPARVISLGLQRNIVLRKDISSLMALFALLRREKFDLIWGVGPKAGLLAMSAGWAARIPKRLFIFQGEVWANKSGMGRFVLKTMDRLIARLATHLLTVGHFEREFLCQQGVLSRQQGPTLGRGSIAGVDTGKFHPDPVTRTEMRDRWGIPEDAVAVLFLGRLNADKGIEDLAHAFHVARKTCPRLWLLMVGPDENGMAKRINTILDDAQERRHTLIGFTEQPAACFNAADIFCLPSYREGFPVSLLEAAASGLPSIGSDIYGIRGALIHGVTGLLFNAGNREDLADALVRLGMDEAGRAAMGASARQYAKNHFEQDEVLARYSSFFRQMLIGPKSAAIG
ncbi:glycosyltransferase [Herbaspirillum sp. AP02]|uniref:glycosyltransferase n=1 Tax=unclassified Herbaspirillum TaxID=2624150 RepID=UPI0015DB9606|nr:MULTISPECIES: glycosyltransferase [unclassified Herbaspirillum]MBG7620188.1 glycosyltransferase [Herbaspirillum sp. AP02]NZD67652.1 glycosyltransferase [Herbaspirillum sp. AP21]